MDNNCRRIYTANMFRICIDAWQEDFSGRVYSPMSEDKIVFMHIGELLLKMDKLFDSIGYPQAFQQKRSFVEKKLADNSYRGIPAAVRQIESILDKNGRCCTYDIAVNSRHNTSWQGVIYDVDGMDCGKFDGEIELLEKLSMLVNT